jgi:hypothetical protein
MVAWIQEQNKTTTWTVELVSQGQIQLPPPRPLPSILRPRDPSVVADRTQNYIHTNTLFPYERFHVLRIQP